MGQNPHSLTIAPPLNMTSYQNISGCWWFQLLPKGHFSPTLLGGNVIGRHDYLLLQLPSFSRMQQYKNICAQLHFPFSFLILSSWVLIILTKYINWFHFSSSTWGHADALQFGSQPLVQFSLVNKPSSINPFSELPLNIPSSHTVVLNTFFFHFIFQAFPSSKHFMLLIVFKCFPCFIPLPTNNIRF